MTRQHKIFISLYLAVAAALVAVLICVVMPMMTDHRLDVKVNRADFPIKGIDISHHNGPVDFEAVKADSVTFVIIKATDGVGDTDPRFIHNLNGARKAGLDIGVYHYFRYHRDGTEQANSLLETVEGLDIDLPLIIDVEDNDNDRSRRSLVAPNLRKMVDRLHAAGRRVMVYVNLREYNSFIRDNFDDVDLWLASSRHPDMAIPHRRLWQHSHHGKVDGITGPVDINTFNGTADQYRAWLNDAK